MARVTKFMQIDAALQHIVQLQQGFLAHRSALLGAWVARLGSLVSCSAQPIRAAWSAGFAAPLGRTLKTGEWGCIWFPLLTIFAVEAQAFELPSGEAITFQESFYERQDDGALWARFRFVMPNLGPALPYAAVADDFMVLCEAYVLPALADQEMPAQIVISLADRETPFGIAVPEATQYFEAFRPEGLSCIWEGF